MAKLKGNKKNAALPNAIKGKTCMSYELRNGVVTCNDPDCNGKFHNTQHKLIKKYKT